MDSSSYLQERTGPDHTLRGLRLLIVEDDYLVASELADSMRRRGASVLGPVGNVRGARDLARREQPDFALLDINLNGSPTFELAGELQAMGIGMIFTTGYDPQILPERFRAIPCVQKPVNFAALVAFIKAAS